MTPKRTILIVDDDPAILKMLSRLLGQDYDVRTISDSRQAVAAVQERQPDLLLLDIRMPGMNGVDVIRALKREKPDLRVVMITGDMDIDDVQSALDAGARACVNKPFMPQEVKSVVERALSSDPPGGQIPEQNRS